MSKRRDSDIGRDRLHLPGIKQSPGKFAALVGPQGVAEYVDERKRVEESVRRRKRQRLARILARRAESLAASRLQTPEEIII